MRYSLIIIPLFISLTKGLSQVNILDQPDILEKVEKCLYLTYGFHFDEAQELQSQLERRLPNHPAPFFLRALIIYWGNFPLLPDNPKVDEFETAIEQTLENCKSMINTQDGNLEGIFFDMHARAFEGMFWADNGKISKVIPDLDNMYRSTMKGIEYKDQFKEFYFSSALYNYYMEVYIDKHPIYKPLVFFFHKGDKALGLRELEFATKNTTYIKYEAILFMSLIQLNYEENLDSALDYMSILYNNFPDNIYYLAQYLIILLHNKNYSVAAALDAKLLDDKDDFHQMIYFMCEGFLQENTTSNDVLATANYKKTIFISEKIGPFADLYAAIAYAGLARIAGNDHDENLARKYRRSSSQHSTYDFILDF